MAYYSLIIVSFTVCLRSSKAFGYDCSTNTQKGQGPRESLTIAAGWPIIMSGTQQVRNDESGEEGWIVFFWLICRSRKNFSLQCL